MERHAHRRCGIIVVIAIVQYVLPEFNEVPEQFSAVVLWRFRVAALGIQVVLWTTIGLLFGVLAERSSPIDSGNGTR